MIHRRSQLANGKCLLCSLVYSTQDRAISGAWSDQHQPGQRGNAGEDDSGESVPGRSGSLEQRTTGIGPVASVLMRRSIWQIEVLQIPMTIYDADAAFRCRRVPGITSQPLIRVPRRGAWPRLLPKRKRFLPGILGTRIAFVSGLGQEKTGELFRTIPNKKASFRFAKTT